jgi:hypothetical protein
MMQFGHQPRHRVPETTKPAQGGLRKFLLFFELLVAEARFELATFGL